MCVGGGICCHFMCNFGLYVCLRSLTVILTFFICIAECILCWGLGVGVHLGGVVGVIGCMTTSNEIAPTGFQLLPPYLASS